MLQTLLAGREAASLQLATPHLEGVAFHLRTRPPEMTALRRALAFIYGFALMYFAGIWLTGFMAARQISPEYFRLFSGFGQGGKDAAHAILGVALHLVPTVALLGLGILSAVLLVKQDRRAVGFAAIAGCAVSYCFWLVYFSLQSTSGAWSLSAVFSPYVHAPWWAWPNILGPLLGMAAALALLSRHAAQRPGA